MQHSIAAVASPIDVRRVRWGLRLPDERLPGGGPHAATPTDRKSVESARSPQEFCTRLFEALGGHAVLSVASDGYGTLGWPDFDGGNGNALVEAADDFLRWMGSRGRDRF